MIELSRHADAGGRSDAKYRGAGFIMANPCNGHIPAAFPAYGPSRRASVILDSNQRMLGQSPLLDPAITAGSFCARLHSLDERPEHRERRYYEAVASLAIHRSKLSATRGTYGHILLKA